MYILMLTLGGPLRSIVSTVSFLEPLSVISKPTSSVNILKFRYSCNVVLLPIANEFAIAKLDLGFHIKEDIRRTLVSYCFLDT